MKRVFAILVAAFLISVQAENDILARIKWEQLPDGESLRLTITPVSTPRKSSSAPPRPATDDAHRSSRQVPPDFIASYLRNRRQEDPVGFGDETETETKRQEDQVGFGEKVRRQQDIIGFKSRRRRSVDDNQIQVMLKRDKVFDDNFPIVVDGELRNDVRKRNLAYYTTPDQSSMSVETERRSGRVRRFAEGEFFHRGRRYLIRRSLQPGPNLHLLSPKRATISRPIPQVDQVVKKAVERRRRQEEKAGPYYIELAVFTDVSVFLHMTRRGKGASKEQVIKNIHHRVGHIIHGVDLAYRRMKMVDMSVWLKALYVSTEYSTSYPITINALDKTSAPRWNDVNPRANCKADANKIRENVNNWLSAQKFTADHAMAFTMYDLWDLKDHIDVVGQADFANMCGENHWRGSCVEWGSFHVWATAAHELAHNLNVAHDGQETSDMCDTKEYYLMTTDSVFHDRSTIDNGFRFSECTEWTIIDTMNENAENGRNCLGNKITAHAAGLSAHLKSHLPGQEYNLHQQCQIVYGDKSKPCVRKADFEEICVILYCTNPARKDHECQNPGDFRAAMGTPCDNGKWCYEGRCVANPRAKFYNPQLASKDYVEV